MAALNYHHLRYFREVATEGHLGRTAERMNVSQSALSIQIKQLEERIGHRLFDRIGRSLVLTEAGHIALDYADRIFSAGEELLSTLDQAGSVAPPLRIGALSTLSRNFQLQFLRSLMASGDARITLKSGNTKLLMEDLRALTLDVVLTTELPHSDEAPVFAAKKIAEQKVALHGKPELMRHDTLSDLLATAPLVLPTESIIRAEFENLTVQLGVQPNIIADVDDMAMVRLLAREGVGVAVAPEVVVADEIANGTMVSAPFDLGFVEPFYAVTIPRRFPHPALSDMLRQA